MDKQLFFLWLDEWAESRGVLQPGAVTDLGEAYDFASVIRRLFGNKTQGPAMRALLATAPTRVLFRHNEISERESAILEFNRDLIHGEPNWFVAVARGASVAREARDVDGNVLNGLMVVPIVNQRVNRNQVLDLEQAVEEVTDWLRAKVAFAVAADHNPEGAQDFR